MSFFLHLLENIIHKPKNHLSVECFSLSLPSFQLFRLSFVALSYITRKHFCLFRSCNRLRLIFEFQVIACAGLLMDGRTDRHSQVSNVHIRSFVGSLSLNTTILTQFGFSHGTFAYRCLMSVIASVSLATTGRLNESFTNQEYIEKIIQQTRPFELSMKLLNLVQILGLK